MYNPSVVVCVTSKVWRIPTSILPGSGCCCKVNPSTLSLGLDECGHELSKSLWVSMFVTITASLSGLKSLRSFAPIEPKGTGRCLLAPVGRP
jgi:hypothetical protein